MNRNRNNLIGRWYWTTKTHTNTYIDHICYFRKRPRRSRAECVIITNCASWAKQTTTATTTTTAVRWWWHLNESRFAHSEARIVVWCCAVCLLPIPLILYSSMGILVEIAQWLTTTARTNLALRRFILYLTCVCVCVCGCLSIINVWDTCMLHTMFVQRRLAASRSKCTPHNNTRLTYSSHTTANILYRWSCQSRSATIPHRLREKHLHFLYFVVFVFWWSSYLFSAAGDRMRSVL